MFILVQFPLADLRPLIRGEMGRLPQPDWTADDPGEGFIRAFGKMATRNSEGYGLIGERAFADFNHAVRLRDTLAYQQGAWLRPLHAELRFRRLYFDGRVAGRFEFGFLVDDDEEEVVSRATNQFAYDPSQLAAAVQRLRVGFPAPDGGEHLSNLGSCSKALGLAYIVATTRQKDLNAFPPAETYGSAVVVGKPIIHLRVSGERAIVEDRDRRLVDGTDGRIQIASVAGAQARNTVVVQLSGGSATGEVPTERANRVLFAHLNALLFAHSHFLRVRDQFDFGGRQALKVAVQDMIGRLQNFVPTAPPVENDEEFAAAIKAFGAAYVGRTDELISKIEAMEAEITAQTPVEKAGGYLKGLFELVLTTAVKAGVELAGKAG